jgi:hypothetical protein
MFRRFVPLTSLALFSTFTSRADAAGAWLSGGATAPIEQRVAIAVASERVTLWTSLRLNDKPGAIGVVVPVPPGASIDHSSDAWFEALEAATAPRIFPPGGASPFCTGTEGWPNPFHITTNLGQSPGLLPTESVLLDSPGAVSAWAAKHGFKLAPETATALESMSGMRFFAERFVALKGDSMTSTLRVVSPGGAPVLPLALLRAGSEDLHVTAWLVGKGRGNLQGAENVAVPIAELRWDAAYGISNYPALRASELASKGVDAVLLEAASHDALSDNQPIADGKASIPGATMSYFVRTNLYGDSDVSPSSCIGYAGAALTSSSVVAESCPRADLGVVEGSDTCVESPAAGQVNPSTLRCGGRSDDLAVALSGLVPSQTWLTRRTLLVPKGASGLTWPVSFGSAMPVEPVLVASSIEFDACDAGSGSGSSSSSGSGSGAGSDSSGSGSGAGAGPIGNPTGGYVEYGPGYESDMGCGCTADPVIIDGDGGSGDGYGGDGGDDYSYDDSTEDCSGDTSDDEYEDSSDDCSGDTGDERWDEGSSGDETSSDETSSECTIATHRPAAKAHKRGPKLSMLTLGLLAILAPLRRMRRPTRTARGARNSIPMTS